MGRREKISYIEKIAAVKQYKEGEKTLRAIGASLGVHHSSVEKWITLYQTFGEEGLHSNRENQIYSEAVKREAVRCYLKGGKTMHEVSQQYRLRSLSQLQYWIKKYEEENIEIRSR